MELIILDDRLEEVGRFSNFESLVWNERFQTPGDFQMTSYGIVETTAAIRTGMFVGSSRSDFVMQVLSIDTSVDTKGAEVVTISGKTLEYILSHRPAIQRVASISSMDAEHPDGWEFGQPHNNPDEDPFDIMRTVLHNIDDRHYSRAELSYLQLPFSYYEYSEDNGIGIVSKSVKMPHYSIDRAATVQDVFDELLPQAEMGVATLRPNMNSALAESHTRNHWRETADRHALFVHYRPRIILNEGQITFNHNMEDYTSESITRNVEYSNAIIQADLGHVLHARGEFPSETTGLAHRVKLQERDTSTLSDHESGLINRNIGFDVFDDYTQSITFSLETSGHFPFDQKKYQFGDRSENTYFLGDAVTLNLKGASGAVVQIMEYIRTMDANGYREYPVFQTMRKINNVYNVTILNYENLVESHQWN